ncbi:MAG: VWA domain-containing protein [Anaerolineae bacterium]|nr:VWA domain-containing protein [Anaerolineae bacterium]
MQKILFSSSTHFGGDHIPVLKEPQVFYSLLACSADIKKDDETRISLNVCFVVDCSTSMRGLPLELMKKALANIGRWLHPDDFLSIVSFNDRAETIIKTSKVSEIENLSRNLAKIHALGGTEIYQGLKRGYVQLIRTPNFKRTIPHLVLITDGRTYGDEEMCMRLVKSSRTEGITFSAVGIGDEWNDELLDQMAGISGGETRYITNTNMLAREVELLMVKFSQSTVPSTSLEYRIHDRCEVSNIYRLSPDVTPLVGVDNVCTFGTLVPASPIQILFEFRIHPIQLSQSSLTLLEGSLKTNGNNPEFQQASHPVNISVPVQAGSTKTALPSNQVMSAVYAVSIYRMQENARKMIQQGNISEGVNVLKNLARQLNAQGNKQLADQIERETVFISEHQSYSEGGAKQIKYATRLLTAETQQVVIRDATRKVERR